MMMMMMDIQKKQVSSSFLHPAHPQSTGKTYRFGSSSKQLCSNTVPQYHSEEIHGRELPTSNLEKLAKMEVDHISYPGGCAQPWDSSFSVSYLQRYSFGLPARYSGIYVLTVKCISEPCGTNQPLLVTLFFQPMRLQKNGKIKVHLEVRVQSLASIYCRSPNSSPFPSRSISGLQVYTAVSQTPLGLESQFT